MNTSFSNNDNDGGSVASSTWSASLFSWLPGTASVAESSMGKYSSSSLMDWQQEKQHEISACLNGNAEDERVDLWKLRELALTRGGLVSSSTRKRAWPKLMGAHEQLLLNTSKEKQVEISNQDLHLLEKDIRQKMKWHIQDHVKMARKLQAQVDRQERQHREDVCANKKVTFASPPGLVVSSPDTASTKQDGCSSTNNGIVPPVASITTNGATDQDVSVELTSPMSGACTPNFNSTSLLNLSTITTTTEKKEKIRLSSHEQKILTNVIISLLRTKPSPPDDDSDESRYHYVSGLHNLAALLLINLESPSLTSIVLTKLASFHLRDVLTQEESLRMAVQLTVPPLLQTLDPALYQFCCRAKMTSFSPIISWIKYWFAEQHESENVKVASRLLDVFLASHALMPIYLSVAVMTHPESRNRILDTPCSLKAMHDVLRELPTQLTLEEEDPMEIWESVIETAVSYMSLVPLPLLGELIGSSSTAVHSEKSVTSIVSSIAMFQAPPPAWTISSTAPTDWSLLQQAKQMRLDKKMRGGTDDAATTPQEKASQVEQKETVILENIETKFPLAMAASGLSIDNKAVGKQSKNKIRCIILLLIAGIAVLLLVSSGFVWNQYTFSAVQHVVPKQQQLDTVAAKSDQTKPKEQAETVPKKTAMILESKAVPNKKEQTVETEPVLKEVETKAVLKTQAETKPVLKTQAETKPVLKTQAETKLTPKKTAMFETKAVPNKKEQTVETKPVTTKQAETKPRKTAMLETKTVTKKEEQTAETESVLKEEKKRETKPVLKTQAETKPIPKKTAVLETKPMSKKRTPQKAETKTVSERTERTQETKALPKKNEIKTKSVPEKKRMAESMSATKMKEEKVDTKPVPKVELKAETKAFPEKKQTVETTSVTKNEKMKVVTMPAPKDEMKKLATVPVPKDEMKKLETMQVLESKKAEPVKKAIAFVSKPKHVVPVPESTKSKDEQQLVDTKPSPQTQQPVKSEAAVTSKPIFSNAIGKPPPISETMEKKSSKKTEKNPFVDKLGRGFQKLKSETTPLVQNVGRGLQKLKSVVMQKKEQTDVDEAPRLLSVMKGETTVDAEPKPKRNLFRRFLAMKAHS